MPSSLININSYSPICPKPFIPGFQYFERWIQCSNEIPFQYVLHTPLSGMRSPGPVLGQDMT